MVRLQLATSVSVSATGQPQPNWSTFESVERVECLSRRGGDPAVPVLRLFVEDLSPWSALHVVLDTVQMGIQMTGQHGV